MSTLNNPEEVERILALRRQKQALNAPVKRPPPERAGLVGELKHPRLATLVTGWMEITPERALHYLDYNAHNRKMNKNKVASFARQHAAGDFVDTHQGIAFNDADELADGQHTLKMILLTGKPLLRMVTFGLPRKPSGKEFTTMDVIDAGGRSVADQLAISYGVKDSGAVKQICGALASLCYGGRTRLLSVGQTLAVYHAFQASVDFAIANRSKNKGLRQAGVLAGFAFAHAAMGSAAATVEKWFIELNSGAGLVDEATYLARRKQARKMRPVEHFRWFLLSDEAELFSKSMNKAIAEVTLQVFYGEAYKAVTQALEQSAVGTKWFAAKQKERVAKIAGLFRLPEGK